jgi:hypothetical protein
MTNKSAYSDILLQCLSSEFLEGLLDVLEVDLAARHHDPDESVVICPQAFHRLLKLTGKMAKLVPHAAHCIGKNKRRDKNGFM